MPAQSAIMVFRIALHTKDVVTGTLLKLIIIVPSSRTHIDIKYQPLSNYEFYTNEVLLHDSLKSTPVDSLYVIDVEINLWSDAGAV